MRRILCLLIVLLGLVAIGNAQGTIIKKGKLKNQTAPIPETVIVTPSTDGLFRLSVYATVTTANIASESFWSVNLFWTDDAGPQVGPGVLFTYQGVSELGSFIPEYSPYGTGAGGGFDTVFEAKAGTPISYSVTQQGLPDNSAYSLYYTLERLE